MLNGDVEINYIKEIQVSVEDVFILAVLALKVRISLAMGDVGQRHTLVVHQCERALAVRTSLQRTVVVTVLDNVGDFLTFVSEFEVFNALNALLLLTPLDTIWIFLLCLWFHQLTNSSLGIGVVFWWADEADSVLVLLFTLGVYVFFTFDICGVFAVYHVVV